MVRTARRSPACIAAGRKAPTATPKVAHFSVNVDLGLDYRDGWSEVPAAASYVNPYRVGWEEYLRHVAAGTPLRSTLAAGIRDVQLAEACHSSIREDKWVTLDALS